MKSKKDHFVMTGVPEWLMVPKTHVGPPYTEHDIKRILDHLADGNSYASLRRVDQTLPTYYELWKYLKTNPQMLDNYFEAQLVGAESLVDLGIDLMNSLSMDNGSIVPVDTASVREQLQWIKWVAGARYAKRYGEKKQINIDGKVDLTGAMQAAEERVIKRRVEQLTVIDGEFEIDSDE